MSWSCPLAVQNTPALTAYPTPHVTMYPSPLPTAAPLTAHPTLGTPHPTETPTAVVTTFSRRPITTHSQSRVVTAAPNQAGKHDDGGQFTYTECRALSKGPFMQSVTPVFDQTLRPTTLLIRRLAPVSHLFLECLGASCYNFGQN